MYKKALDHFEEVDLVLFAAAKNTKPFELTQSKDFFASLTREIVGQQLSGKVAQVIYARFEDLFKDKKVSVQSLQKIEDQKLRDVGMAWAKVRSLKDLATKIESGEVKLDQLSKLDNEAVVLELTKVKGIGPWTSEMFLMFALGREDVFSPGDLGLRNGLIKLYNLDHKPTPEEMMETSHKWQPYRTYASVILWRVLDNFEPAVG